jgi:hypothetical protein
MVEKKFTLVWTVRAASQLNSAYDYIRNDSFQNAEKVLTA